MDKNDVIKELKKNYTEYIRSIEWDETVAEERLLEDTVILFSDYLNVNQVNKEYVDKQCQQGHDELQLKSNTNYGYGWICPRCGKVLSPYTKECSCKDNNIYKDSNISDTSFNNGHRCVIPDSIRFCRTQTPSATICDGCCNWVKTSL